MPGPEGSSTGAESSKNAVAATALAATNFGGEVLQTRSACAVLSSSSSSSESVSDTASHNKLSKTRRKRLAAVAKQQEKNRDRSVNEAVAAVKATEATAGELRRSSAVAAASKAIVATSKAMSKAIAATSKAIAKKRKVPPSQDRSRKTAVVTVSRDRRRPSSQSRNRRRSSLRSPPRKEERSRKTDAVAAKKKQRQSTSSSPPAPCSFVERRHIKPRADLQHKQRVVRVPFGYSSSSGDERACRSRGTHVRRSVEHGRVHESVQPACRRDDGHTRHHRRGTQELQKNWVRWPDVRSLSPVDARSCRKPLPRSSSRVSPPKKAPSRESPPKKIRLIPARRPQLRGSLALPWDRYKQREERADAFGAESTTYRPHWVQSQPPWQSTLRRISNLMFVTSYVAESADIACFTKWLGKTGHHCNVILCESSHSAVAEWLMQRTHGGFTEQEELLRSRRIVFVTARIYIVLMENRVQMVQVKEVFNFDNMTFAVAQIAIHDRCATSMHGRSTTVGVGIVYVLPQLRKLPEWLMQKMSYSVPSHGVRCFTGTFGLDGKQIASFAFKYPMATLRPVCQTWRGVDGHTEYVFPCYTLLLGNSTNRTKTGDLVDSAVAVSNKWVPTIYPYEDVMPYWRKMPPGQVEQSAAYDIDWGHVKEKAVSPDRWIPNVHQVLWWCGVAQQGANARINHVAARMPHRSCGVNTQRTRSPKKPKEDRSPKKIAVAEQ